MSIDHSILSKIQMACRERKWDGYAIYAACAQKNRDMCPVWDVKYALEEDSRIRAAVNEDYPHFINVFKFDKLVYYRFKFNEAVWRDMQTYGFLQPMERMLLSCELGIAGKLAKHLVLDPIADRMVQRQDWGDYLRSYMASVDVQIRTLLEDIERAIPPKGTYLNGLCRLYNGSDLYEPYLAKLRAIITDVKSKEVRSEEPSNFGNPLKRRE